MKQEEVIRVALVEDDGGIRDALGRVFRAARDMSLVASYPDAESALADIESARPDIALVDINLPSMSGIEFIRELKSRTDDIQLLVLTVYEDAEKIFQSLSAGANGYLLKRVSPDRLLAAVRELKAGGSPMSGSVARKVVQSFQRMGVSRRDDENLSPRESEILSLLVDGLMYKEISDKTGIAYETVRTYIRRIYEKLHVRTRSEAVARHLGR